MTRWTLAALCALLSTAAPGAQAERPLRFEELARVERLGGFAVAPDGSRVAFALATADVDANTTRSAIWILATDPGAAPVRLTAGDKVDAEPRFSPDGKRLAFLSNRSGGFQIWTVGIAGGDPVPATSFPTEVNGFSWSPDGKWFLVSSDVFPGCTDVPCLEKILKARGQAKVKARVADRLLFRHWDAWKEGTRTHIWKIAVQGGAALDLTPGNRDAPPFAIGGGADWDVSPDSRELVFASNPDRNEAVSTNADLFRVPLSGGAPAENLTEGNPAFDGSPRYSPDGKWIAYRSQKRPGFESDRFRLAVLDRATGRSRALTEDLDLWVDDFRWAPDSKSLVFATQVRGREALYRVPVSGGAAAVLWTGGTVAGLETAANRVYFGASTLSRAAEIWSVDAGGTGAAPLTHVNDALFRDLTLGEVSERLTDSGDGRKLHAWVVRPPGFDPSKKYPAVFFIHGGPQGAWVDGWSYRWNPQVWAAYGYVVYAANPRGSTGFGQDFLDAISGDWGGRVYDDLMRQADDLESLPFVDKARIGAAGASYGGYMIDWIAGHTQRFHALVSHDGIFDLPSANLETEELWFPKWEFQGWPWDSQLYEKWNPMRSAANLKTPTLVITSERDYRVPFGQGLQFFTALQVQGFPRSS